MADVDALELWTIATFNLVVFGLLSVLVGHTSGSLADILAGLGTVEGVLVFGYLWALTVLATRWVLSEGGLDRIREGELSSLVVRGGLAGGLIGAGFLVGVILAGALVNLVTGPWSIRLDGVLPFVLIVVVAGGVAALVGAVVGGVFVIVDAALYRLSSSFVLRQSS
ncbi:MULTISPECIES: hypothetical protein [Haloferax]|uniref:DUF7965 domain-containing protein n=2 Tax=Haloferax TaxID=2251 RepID=A0A6G1Z451_9EURY|nr:MULTISPECIES: hypothetical protein [Haloferax]KAB1188487.1 hypothetical protein Hfx1149_10760 [Haloferax sp. CBA1149]MRW81181.1 hypothetical protein [Haloferax marinisediminis]